MRSPRTPWRNAIFGGTELYFGEGYIDRSCADRDNLPKYIIAVVEDITQEIQAEHALRDSEQRLTLAQDAAHLGVWDRDLRTNVIVSSGQYASLYGLPPDHRPLKYEEWLRLIHPDDRERVQSVVREATKGASVWDTEFRVVWPNGSIHWIDCKGTVFFDDDGRPFRLVGVNFDITARKQTEAALRYSELRYKEVFDITSDSIFLIDVTPDGRFRFAGFNPAAEVAVGFSSMEIAGRFVEDVMADEVALGVISHYRRCLQLGKPINYEEEINLPIGRRYFHTNLIPVRNAAGRIHRIVSVARDITESKQAESALRESEERFRNMADTAPVMIWVSGPDKLCSFFNKGWLIFTGRKLEEELGNGWASGVHADDVDRCLAIYTSSFDARRSFQMEYRLRRADGEYRWLLDSGVPRMEPGGAFAGYIGSCIDITDLKRTQAEVLSTQKLESLGVLAGGIAHDFNNLLGGILAEAELVEADFAAGLPPGEEIERIKSVAIRGAEIVRELMVYAGRDQSGLVEPVDLSLLVEEMLDLLKVSISKKVVLKVNLDKDLPAVWGNAPQLRQVVMNLVINASEAIGEDQGVIRVATSRAMEGPGSTLNNAASPISDYLRLEVSDTGSGMTEEARAKIFDPFFTTKFAGRGLGLAVVQGVVRDHKGAVNVVSDPGHGATFQVLLPCSARRALKAGASTSARAEQAHDRVGTILIVEDEELLRQAVSTALRKKGFSVIEARDGSTGMDLMRRHQEDINVILLDVTLPGRSSKEILDEARRIRPDLKVILTSAYDKNTVDISFSGLPITHFIRKPFQLSDLAGVLQDALSS